MHRLVLFLFTISVFIFLCDPPRLSQFWRAYIAGAHGEVSLRTGAARSLSIVTAVALKLLKISPNF